MLLKNRPGLVSSLLLPAEAGRGDFMTTAQLARPRVKASLLVQGWNSRPLRHRCCGRAVGRVLGLLRRSQDGIVGYLSPLFISNGQQWQDDWDRSPPTSSCWQPWRTSRGARPMLARRPVGVMETEVETCRRLWVNRGGGGDLSQASKY